MSLILGRRLLLSSIDRPEADQAGQRIQTDVISAWPAAHTHHSHARAGHANWSRRPAAAAAAKVEAATAKMPQHLSQVEASSSPVEVGKVKEDKSRINCGFLLLLLLLLLLWLVCRRPRGKVPPHVFVCLRSSTTTMATRRQVNSLAFDIRASSNLSQDFFCALGWILMAAGWLVAISIVLLLLTVLVSVR